MATWPDSTEVIASIGTTSTADAAEVDACLAASVDYLTQICYLDGTETITPEEGEPYDAPTVPEGVRRACVLLTARLFRRRQSAEGVAGFGEFGAVRVSRVDPDIELLIAPHLGWGVA